MYLNHTHAHILMRACPCTRGRGRGGGRNRMKPVQMKNAAFMPRFFMIVTYAAYSSANSIEPPSLEKVSTPD